MKKRHPTRPIKPLPFGVYYTTSLILTLIGLGTTVYLAIAHYRLYTDIGYKSFCAISRSINCDTVSQSPYAVILGMPLAVWGCIGYLFILALLGIALHAKARPGRIWAMIQVAAFLFCGYDLYLAWISSVYIKSYCIMCLLTYAVNFALLYFAWLTRRRFNDGSLIASLRLDGRYFGRHHFKAAGVIVGLAALILPGVAAYPSYWHYALPHSHVGLNTGHTKEGAPWIGATSPELVIEEYSDYLCFQCAKMHMFLRELILRYPDKLRLVHHHFPMDIDYNPIVTAPLHEGAGEMALLALHADRSDKFWEMNDLLFEIGRKRSTIALNKLGDKLDLDAKAMARSIRDKKLLSRLRQDLSSGLRLQISATPSFVINGEVHQGVIPAEVLQAIIK